MKRKKLLSCLLTCVVLMGFASAPVQAVEVSDHVRLSQLEYESVDRYETWRDQAITRVTENVNVTIGADGIVASEDRFLLDAGETVEISCTYSPAFAEVRFGLLDEDGVFYSVKATGGSIRKTISVDVRGKYSFCVKNNSSHEITVRGFVYY